MRDAVCVARPASSLITVLGALLIVRHRMALLTVDVGYGLYMQLYGVTHGLDATPKSAIPVY